MVVIDLSDSNCKGCGKPTLPDGVEFSASVFQSKEWYAWQIGLITKCNIKDCEHIGYYHGRCYPRGSFKGHDHWHNIIPHSLSIKYGL